MPQQFAQNPLNQFESEQLPVGWPWRLLSVSFIIFLVAILTYFGLAVGYSPYLNSRIEKKEAEIDQLAQSVSKEDRDKFIGFYSQLSNLKDLLDNHIFTSRIFPQLEKITNKKVYFIVANLKAQTNELELEGIADNYGILGEQLEAFNQLEGVSSYILNQSRVEEGAVRFKATLKLKNQILR